MNYHLGQKTKNRAPVGALFVAALVLDYAGGYAAAQKIMPPTTPATITPPAGNSAFLVGYAEGTQGYVCLPTSTGASWTVNSSRPEAILSMSSLTSSVPIQTPTSMPPTPYRSAARPGGARWMAA